MRKQVEQEEECPDSLGPGEYPYTAPHTRSLHAQSKLSNKCIVGLDQTNTQNYRYVYTQQEEIDTATSL